MENFESLVSEILEVDSVNPDDCLNSFDSWDSLTILSLIALFDESFGVQLSSEEIENSSTIIGLKELVLTKK